MTKMIPMVIDLLVVKFMIMKVNFWGIWSRGMPYAKIPRMEIMDMVSRIASSKVCIRDLSVISFQTKDPMTKAYQQAKAPASDGVKSPRRKLPGKMQSPDGSP
ncbi:MAG: hypothetical protein WBI82_10260 [Sphaerochaeta sp.]